MSRDVFFVLKVRGKELLDNAGLYLRSFGLAELDQSVRIARVASLATELKVDALKLAKLPKHLLHLLGTLLAKLGMIHGSLVGTLRSIWVQVERKPLGRKCIIGIRVLLFVRCNSLFKSLLANVAPCCDLLASLHCQVALTYGRWYR
jgi:hypothetical protein